MYYPSRFQLKCTRQKKGCISAALFEGEQISRFNNGQAGANPETLLFCFLVQPYLLEKLLELCVLLREELRGLLPVPGEYHGAGLVHKLLERLALGSGLECCVELVNHFLGSTLWGHTS